MLFGVWIEITFSVNNHVKRALVMMSPRINKHSNADLISYSVTFRCRSSFFLQPHFAQRSVNHKELFFLFTMLLLLFPSCSFSEWEEVRFFHSFRWQNHEPGKKTEEAALPGRNITNKQIERSPISLLSMCDYGTVKEIDRQNMAKIK